ncbi:MAG: nucleotidyltransferase family protein [Planctomycetota bacterium]
MSPDIHVDRARIAAFCERWKIVELALFGSALRDDFRPDSDVDVLVSFTENAQWSLFDFAAMMDELSEIFGREVDLVERDGLRNPFRRHAILSSRKILYAA